MRTASHRDNHSTHQIRVQRAINVVFSQVFGLVFVARISMTTLCRQRSFANISAELLGSLLKTHCDFSNKSDSDDIVDTVEDCAHFLHSVATATDRLNAQPLEKALVAFGLPPTHGKLWGATIGRRFQLLQRQAPPIHVPEPVSRVVQAMRHRCGKGPSPSPPRQVVPVPLIATSPSRSLPNRPEPVAVLEPAAAMRLPQTAHEIRELYGLKR